LDYIFFTDGINMPEYDFAENKYIESDWFDVFPLGFEDPGEKQWLDLQEQSLGNHNDTNVIYFINNFRYRDKITPSKGQDAAFGCSNTFGFGVNTAWPSILGLANCGANGISNDYITRCAVNYVKIFKPNNIYVLWTYKQRREHIEKGFGLVKFRRPEVENIPTWRTHYSMLSTELTDNYNFDKNKILLETVCDLYGCNLKQFHLQGQLVLDNNNNVILDQYDYTAARDNLHPGPDWHVNLAASY